jgi:[ribosomal protein S5]-alanine N-acetyltransferase
MVTAVPTLETERLILRAFGMEDAESVQKLAGAREVAEMTLLIPHPYPEGAAEAWIASQPEEASRGTGYVFAVIEKASGHLVGAIGLTCSPVHNRAELGYWLGVPYWGKGYCTEAASAVLRFGFETLALNRIYACHFGTNPASGRVMQKAGMRYEGLLRSHHYKWGTYVDSVCYGLTSSDWAETKSAHSP